nr:unnamed protein product [Digitaria exilis]
MESESVAQVEHLREDVQDLQKEIVQVLKDRVRLNEEISTLHKEFDKYNSYAESALQLMCEACNIDWSDIVRRTAARASSSDHPGTSKQGGTLVDAGINDSHADPPQDHAVADPGSAHVDSPIISCAANAHPKSLKDHD